MSNTFDTQMEIAQTLDAMGLGFEYARGQLEKETGKHICIEKCGLCCMVNTPVCTEFEADYVISLYGHKPEFKAMVNKALEWMTENFTGANSRNINDPLKLQHEVHVLEHQRCPFLQDDMSCGIYEARPLVCRSYGVTMPADEYCPRPLASFENPRKRMLILNDSDISRALSSAHKELLKEGRRIGRAAIGFLPFLITRVMARDELKSLVDHGRVSDTKMAMGKNKANLFQPQGDAFIQQAEEERSDELSGGTIVRLAGEYGDRIGPKRRGGG